MNNILLTASIGVLGIIVGAVLSGIGFLIRNKLENIRIKNEALFNLLSIWRILKFAEPSKPEIPLLTKIYLDKVNAGDIGETIATLRVKSSTTVYALIPIIVNLET